MTRVDEKIERLNQEINDISKDLEIIEAEIDNIEYFPSSKRLRDLHQRADSLRASLQSKKDELNRIKNNYDIMVEISSLEDEKIKFKTMLKPPFELPEGMSFGMVLERIVQIDDKIEQLEKSIGTQPKSNNRK